MLATLDAWRRARGDYGEHRSIAALVDKQQRGRISWHARGSGEMLGCVHMGCRQAGYGRGDYPVDGLASTSRYIPAAPKPGSA